MIFDRPVLRAFATASLLLAMASPAGAEDKITTQADPTKVARWAISYSDEKLGLVEGRAACKLTDTFSCSLVFRDPSTNALKRTTAYADLPAGPGAMLSFKVPAADLPQPAAAKVETDSQKIGNLSGRATITLKEGKTESHVEVDVAAQAPPDTDVTMQLFPQENGSMYGEWRYLADPITRRDREGGGPVGAFYTIADEEIATVRPRTDCIGDCGFLGLQRGRVVWQPLPPRIAAVYVVEDQAAVKGSTPLFPYSGPAPYAPNTLGPDHRTLVIIGEDLPLSLDGTVAVQGIDSREDGLKYTVTDVLNPQAARHSADYDTAFRDLTKGMSERDANEFRRLQAVRVDVTLTGSKRPDPGPKTLRWGVTERRWDVDLQYGDNIAAPRFVRIFNEKDSETTAQLALPERVSIEVDTGTALPLDSIPLRIGGIAGDPIAIDAGKVGPTLYRTQPLVFVDAAAPYVSGATGQVVAVKKGSRVLAAIDRKRTNFLRSSVAAALGSEPSKLWIDSLRQAGACTKPPPAELTDLSVDNWANFAQRPAEAGISYGDHAAMLLLRDAFVLAMRAQIAQLQAVAATDIATDMLNDEQNATVDAWYRSMQEPVTTVPDYPLAAVQVSSPAGTVPYSEAYNIAFKWLNFPSAKPESADAYVAWRRQATREAITFYLGQMNDALDAVTSIDGCDRGALLDRVGAGFGPIAAKLFPLLMRHGTKDNSNFEPGSDDLSVRDTPARGYINGLAALYMAVKGAEAARSARNHVIIAAVTLLVPPIAGATMGAVVAGGEIAGTLTGVIGGFAFFSYDLANQAYEKYLQYEEVKFALGSASQLGLDHYFETDNVKTDWWQAGLMIFGNAVMNGVGIHVASQSLAEGLSIWRGARIVGEISDGTRGIYSTRGVYIGEMPKVELAALHALSAEQQRDVALYMLREQERISRIGIMGATRQFASRVFNAFARQAAGKAEVAASADLSPALEMQAYAPPDDFRAPVPANDPLREAKTGIADESNLAAARQGQSDSAAARGQIKEAPGPPPPDRLEKLPKPTELPGMAPPAKAAASPPKPFPDNSRTWPLRDEPWTVTVDGIPVTFEIERFLDSGSFSLVYKLKRIPPELKAKIPQQLLDYFEDDVVMKIVKPEKFIDVRGWKGGDTAEGGLPGVPVQNGIVKRMVVGRDKLRGVPGNPQADFVAFENVEGFEGAGLLIQKRVKFAAKGGAPAVGEAELFPATPDLEVGESPKAFLKRLSDWYADPRIKQMRRAIYKLSRDLADNNITALDYHGGNVYFEKSAGGYAAKLLDQDFIDAHRAIISGGSQSTNGRFLMWLKAGKPAASTYAPLPDDPMYATPQSMMLKLLEHHGWIKYSGGEAMMMEEGARLLPSELQEFFPDIKRYLVPRKQGLLLFRDAPAKFAFANDNGPQLRQAA